MATLYGMMEVDGHVFQTGNAFHATADLKATTELSASLDLQRNRFSFQMSPPVHVNVCKND